MSLRALLAVAAMSFVPGFGAGLALWKPGEAGIATRIGVATGFGYAIAGVVSFLLAIIHQLAPVPFFALLSAATLGLWYVGLRRASLREHLTAIREEIREDPWSLALGVLVLVAFGVIRFGFTSHIFGTISGFRYWADGLEVADSRGIPEAAIHYGAVHPPTTSKALLNSFNGAVSFVLGRDPFLALPVLLWVGSVGVAAALWALARELGLRFMAPLFPVLLVMNRLILNEELTTDLAGYKAEVFGRLIAVSALVVAIGALRRAASVRHAVVAGLLFAVSTGTHLVPVIVAGAFLAFYAIGVALGTHTFRRLAERGLIIGGAAVIAGALVLFLPRGEIGFGGAFRSDQYERPAGGGRFDPTTYLLTGNVERARRPPPPGAWFYPPGFLFQAFMSEAIPTSPSGVTYSEGVARSGLRSMASSVAIVAFTVAAAAAIFMWFPAQLRPIGPAAIGLGVFLFAVALLFSFRYDVYLLARFGIRRMQDYSSVPIVLLGLTLLEGGVLAAKRAQPLVASIAGTVMVVVVAALVVPSAKADSRDGVRGSRVVRTLQSVRARIPCEARILASVRTSGTFEATTGRVAILEGMAPYLRPDLLRETVPLLRSAQAFFRNPSAHRRFLQEEGVDYVLAVDQTVPLGFLTYDFSPSSTRLARAPFLRASGETNEAKIFRVMGLRKVGSFPNPSGWPGFRCITAQNEGSAR